MITSVQEGLSIILINNIPITLNEPQTANEYQAMN